MADSMADSLLKCWLFLWKLRILAFPEKNSGFSKSLWQSLGRKSILKEWKYFYRI